MRFVALRKVCSLIFVVAILCSGCATTYSSSENAASPQAAVAPDPRGTIPGALERDARSAECEGKDYEDAFGMIGDSIDNTDGLHSYELKTMFAKLAAESLLKLGEEAQTKSCVSAARKAYLGVIDSFTGGAYEAYRQRAQIGIDDLRQMHGTPRKS